MRYLVKHNPHISFSVSALLILEKHTLLGNVRQLLNLVERCVIMSEGNLITASIVAECIQNDFEAIPSLGMSQDEVEEKEITFHSEEDAIKTILVKNMGNRKKTANELGISTTTLWRKLKKYQLI